MNVLSQLHVNFLSPATSTVTVDNDSLTGRPYGGTGVLYKRSLSNVIAAINTNESRMTAFVLWTANGVVLLVSMPTNYITLECVEFFNI